MSFTIFVYVSVVQIKLKLESGKYDSYESAAYDMRLIWCNAMVYNAPGSKIYQLAKTLSESWEQQWAVHFPDDPGRYETQYCN